MKRCADSNFSEVLCDKNTWYFGIHDNLITKREKKTPETMPVIVITQENEITAKRKYHCDIIENTSLKKHKFNIETQPPVNIEKEKKRRCDVLNIPAEEKSFRLCLSPQAKLEGYMQKLFDKNHYININIAEKLFVFFKETSFSKLDFNKEAHGASIFLHMMTFAKKDGNLAPFVLNKLCDENLLDLLDWNAKGKHPSHLKQTPLTILRSGLHNKNLTARLKALTSNKCITPLCLLQSQNSCEIQIELDEIVEEFIDDFASMKIEFK